MKLTYIIFAIFFINGSQQLTERLIDSYLETNIHGIQATINGTFDTFKREKRSLRLELGYDILKP